MALHPAPILALAFSLFALSAGPMRAGDLADAVLAGDSSRVSA